MPYLLTKTEIKSRINAKKYLVTKAELINRLDRTQNIFNKIMSDIKKLEDKILKNSSNILWQLGHIQFFYLNLIFSNLLDEFWEKSILEKFNWSPKKFQELIQFYDSFITPSNLRNQEHLILSLEVVVELNEWIFKKLKSIVLENESNFFHSYLIMLGILHQEMHHEALLFHILLNNKTISWISPSNNILSIRPEPSNLISQIEWISYPESNFIQGTDDYSTHLIFDNEQPPFPQTVNKFEVSKYPITEAQYTEFIIAGGYENKDFWNPVSWLWKEKENIKLPLYWKECGNSNSGSQPDSKTFSRQFKIKKNGKWRFSLTNYPVCHISFWEAEAFCAWKKVRLPDESEYEYMTTNGGLDKFPWGEDIDAKKYCNLNYQKYIVEVTEYKNGENKKGVSQLMGNVWEWCQEPIYPYDNFVIDPVYREMSYPFFGEKRICKGGCWAVPDFLIHPRYRNAQPPTCREQFIGFRVCR